MTFPRAARRTVRLTGSHTPRSMSRSTTRRRTADCW
jgi:hypothetical protein